MATGSQNSLTGNNLLNGMPDEQDDVLISSGYEMPPAFTEDARADHGTGGTGSSATVSTTSDPLINGLLRGFQWTLGTLTYTDPDNANDYQAGYVVDDDKDTISAQNEGFSQISATQMFAVQYALDEIGGAGFSVESFTNLVIDYGGNGLGTGTIRVANTSDNDTGLTFYPGDDFYAGDAWMGTDIRTPVQGNYAWNNTLHELGHALGLKHGHEARGAFDALASEWDSLEFTLMTYRSYIGGATSYSNQNWDYPQTYMMLDIQALQHLYGADFNSNGGDTVYTWNETTGQGYVNGVLATNPGSGIGGAANRIFMTIWDGGGSDTYDLSNYDTAMKLDLRPGEWSTFDTAQLARLNGSGTELARGNVANALLYQGDTRSLIENAVGGSGSDEIIGNVLDNHLSGGAGADTIYGELGNDILDGGFEDMASDTLIGGYGIDILNGFMGDDKLYGDYVDVYHLGDNDLIFGGGGKDYIQGGGGDDDLYGDNSDNPNYTTGDDRDFLHGGAGKDRIWGGGENDTLYGGSEDDSLYGGHGDDELRGENGIDFLDGGYGNDSLFGGAGADLIYGGATDNDYIEGGADIDTIDAGYGDDIIHGDDAGQVTEGSMDFLKGGGGKDTIHGGGGADQIYGDFDSAEVSDPDIYTLGADNDVLYGDGGSDIIHGGGGHDLLDGGDEFDGTGDILLGGDGNDEIYGRAGNDLLDGGDGEDTMDGGDGNDSYYADDKNDTIQEDENEGFDYVYSLSDSYTLSAHVEYLVLLEHSNVANGFGGETANFIYGNAYNNRIEGNGGNDFLYGAGGGDTLKGGAGGDYMFGGSGKDKFFGGGGKDTFLFYSSDESGDDKRSADIIADFGKGDEINLSYFEGTLGWVGKSKFTGHGPEVGFQKTTGGLLVRVDDDGDRKIDMMIFCEDISSIAKNAFEL